AADGGIAADVLEADEAGVSGEEECDAICVLDCDSAIGDGCAAALGAKAQAGFEDQAVGLNPAAQGECVVRDACGLPVCVRTVEYGAEAYLPRLRGGDCDDDHLIRVGLEGLARVGDAAEAIGCRRDGGIEVQLASV